MIYDNLKQEEYFNVEALSYSGLKLILKSPLHFKNSPYIESAAMNLGSAVHCALLEPERFKEEYILVEGDGRTKAVKELLAQIENDGKKAIKATDYNTIINIKQAISENKTASELLNTPGRSEVAIIIDENDIKLKGKIDRLTENNIIIDIKTTTDASPTSFLKSIYKYKYNLQALFYQRLIKSETGKNTKFYFIAVETVQPYGVGVYECSLGLLAEAEIDFNKGIDIYKKCIKTNTWNGYPDEIVTLRSWNKQTGENECQN